MQMYHSEMRHFPHPRSADAMRAQAMVWGSTIGKFAAEAFQVVRLIQ